MIDDNATAVDDTVDSEMLPDEQPVTESAARDRNPNGTYAASESDGDEPVSALDDTADEAPADSGDSEEIDGDEAPKREQGKHASERIGQLTAQRNEARARIAALETKLSQYQPKEVDPNLEYENPAAFQKGILEQTLDSRDAQRAFDEAQQAQDAAFNKSVDMFFERLEPMRAEMPDFDQVFEKAAISPVAVDFLADSEAGPRIAYHLGKNPTLANRIYRMQPVQQAVELTRLEAKLSAPPARRSTQAPKPPRTISGGSNPQSVDPSTMDYATYKKWRMGSAA